MGGLLLCKVGVHPSLLVPPSGFLGSFPLRAMDPAGGSQQLVLPSEGAAAKPVVGV